MTVLLRFYQIWNKAIYSYRQGMVTYKSSQQLTAIAYKYYGTWAIHMVLKKGQTLAFVPF